MRWTTTLIAKKNIIGTYMYFQFWKCCLWMFLTCNQKLLDLFLHLQHKWQNWIWVSFIENITYILQEKAYRWSYGIHFYWFNRNCPVFSTVLEYLYMNLLSARVSIFECNKYVYFSIYVNVLFNDAQHVKSIVALFYVKIISKIHLSVCVIIEEYKIIISPSL